MLSVQTKCLRYFNFPIGGLPSLVLYSLNGQFIIFICLYLSSFKNILFVLGGGWAG